jgi:bacterioferritin
MGQLGRQIDGIDVEELHAQLLRAYADEWFAHYNYFYVSHILRGPTSPTLVTIVRRKSQDALEHAHRLARRLKELGAEPVSRLGDLEKHATDKPFKVPESVHDLDGFLKAILDAERTSIRTYRELLATTAGRDHLTARLTDDLLGEAIRGEEELEQLLDTPATEMTGR